MSPLARRSTSWAEKPAELQPLTPTASRSRVAVIEFRVARGGAGLLPVGAGGADEVFMPSIAGIRHATGLNIGST